MNEGMQNLVEIENLENQPLNRIADALEEILRLVKKDQEESKKRWEKESEQKTRASNGPRLPAALALALESGPELQAPSRKLQASSCKLDKGPVLCYRSLQEKEI